MIEISGIPSPRRRRIIDWGGASPWSRAWSSAARANLGHPLWRTSHPSRVAPCDSRRDDDRVSHVSESAEPLCALVIQHRSLSASVCSLALNFMVGDRHVRLISTCRSSAAPRSAATRIRISSHTDGARRRDRQTSSAARSIAPRKIQKAAWTESVLIRRHDSIPRMDMSTTLDGRIRMVYR